MATAVHTRLHYEVDVLAEMVCETKQQMLAKVAACAELLILSRRLWGSSVCVARHGSTKSNVALQSSALDVVVGGIASLPAPDNPGGNGYLPPTREVVAKHLKQLEMCAHSRSCFSGLLAPLPWILGTTPMHWFSCNHYQDDNAHVDQYLGCAVLLSWGTTLTLMLCTCCGNAVMMHLHASRMPCDALIY
jgi:hypothetical protein